MPISAKYSRPVFETPSALCSRERSGQCVCMFFLLATLQTVATIHIFRRTYNVHNTHELSHSQPWRRSNTQYLQAYGRQAKAHSPLRHYDVSDLLRPSVVA
jgi:hypothetical protein